MTIDVVPAHYKHNPLFQQLQEMIAGGEIRRMILSISKRFLGEDEVQDLEQNVLLRVIRRDIPALYDPAKKKSFNSFVFMVVKSSVLSLWRDESRKNMTRGDVKQLREVPSGDHQELLAFLSRDQRGMSPAELVERQALYHAFKAELEQAEFPPPFKKAKVAETPLGTLELSAKTVWRLWEAGYALNQIAKLYGASHYKILDLLRQVYSIYKKYL